MLGGRQPLLPIPKPSALHRRPVWHMKRAVWVGVTIITSFYFLVSVLGYLAYGYEALYGEARCARWGR